MTASIEPKSGRNELFFVDGQPVAPENYVVRADDPGFTVGINVFETMRTYDGHMFRLEPHLARLMASANSLGVPIPSAEVLRAEILSAVVPDADSRVRLAITKTGRRLMNTAPIDTAYVHSSLRVVLRHWEPPAWLGGRVKHGSRAFTVSVVEAAGVDEVFWIDSQRHLLEGGRSSIFGVVDGRLVTPPDDGRILAGVTRQALLDAAADAGIEATIGPVSADADFTELYASSTLRELGAVTEIEGRTGPGAGPVGRAVLAAFTAIVQREKTAQREKAVQREQARSGSRS
jgi:branched-chain amino acid aminotransferase